MVPNQEAQVALVTVLSRRAGSASGGPRKAARIFVGDDDLDLRASERIRILFIALHAKLVIPGRRGDQCRDFFSAPVAK